MCWGRREKFAKLAVYMCACVYVYVYTWLLINSHCALDCLIKQSFMHTFTLTAIHSAIFMLLNIFISVFAIFISCIYAYIIAYTHTSLFMQKNNTKREYVFVCMCVHSHAKKSCHCRSPLQFVVAYVMPCLIRRLMCQWLGRKSRRAAVCGSVWQVMRKSSWDAQVSTLCPWLCDTQTYIHLTDTIQLNACSHSLSLPTSRPLCYSSWLRAAFRCG